MSKKLELKSERLLLRTPKNQDARAIFKYRSDAETNKYQTRIPKSIEEVNTFLNEIASELNIINTWFQFVIVELESDKIIGDLGIHFIDEHQAEIGCTLAKEKHGNGYAAEAMKTVIDFLFNNLNKHRIIGSVDPDNKRSISLMERLGFRKEGHFKESLLFNGKWVDDIIYAMLKSEWGQHKNN